MGSAPSPEDPAEGAAGEGAPSVTLSDGAEGPAVEGPNAKPQTLASALAGKPAAFVNADVALDGEPVIGSFTVDGLTYAVLGESTVELVGVAPSVILSEGTGGPGVEGSDESPASEDGVADLALPEIVREN